MSPLKTGDKVRREHPYDGSPKAGEPVGPVLTVIAIEDFRPVGGTVEKDAVCRLSDGLWEFEWNLHQVKEEIRS